MRRNESNWMQRRAGRVRLGAAAGVGSIVTVVLAGPAASDTRGLTHSEPPRINGYVSAGSDSPTTASMHGAGTLRRDALQAPAPQPNDSESFFLNVSHDEAR